MARFEIKSKDGNSIRHSGKPRYNGSYLKPSYLEFTEVASSSPIQWEVGDYVDYPRTGMRYRLYSIPQPSKNARKGAVGNSFTYSNVQFFSATKELEIALFRDLVDNDNNIHFSTSPDVATFENVEGIIRRIQVCMNDLYPDRWEIRLASFDANEDAEVIERIAEPRDFALSGGTCLDALSKIYDLWDGIGWFHSHENGKEIITVGYANTRNAGNTTESYLYGKGNGLTAIKKHQTNKEEFATRLYVYGSERNLPARYYNDKDILNAESVDIRNLMLPLDSWGKTDGLPDAHKAYLENAEAVAKFGIIPKVHYFDSVDAGADIYPSIEGMTIGDLRKALEALGDMRYYPSESAYPDANKRVDEVRNCTNPEDAGEINPKGFGLEEVPFTALWGKTRKKSTSVVSDTAQIASFEFSIDKPTPCEVVVTPNVSGYIEDKGFDSVSVTLRFKDHSGTAPYNPIVTIGANKVEDRWEFTLPNIRYDYAVSPRTVYPVYLDFIIEAFGDSPEHAAYILNEGTITYALKPIQEKNFVIQLDEIGFNIDEMALKGKGKTISMKTGACAGRNFVIEDARKKAGYWNLTCTRQQDNTLGLLFPNNAYKIEKGDRFVLLNIAMPETYIYVASDRLLYEGEKLLAQASRIQNHYEPAIDAKVMIESGRTLREGMFMQIEDEDIVDNNTDYIIIDTLSIYEDESAIPTYKVTLRERRRVTYKGTPTATSETDTQPAEDTTKETTASSFESFWEEDENGNVFTSRQVRIKNNLIVDGDTASGGEGGNNEGGDTIVLDTEMSDTSENGVQNKVIKAYVDLHPQYEIISDVEDPGNINLSGINGIKVNDTTYTDVNGDGIVDISDAFDGLQPDIDLSPYAKAEDVAKTYATKQEVKAIEDTVAEYQPWLESLKPLIEEKDGDVHIKTNIIVDGDTASSGEGVDVQIGINQEQLQQYLDDHNYVTEDDIESLIPEYDLTPYATKHEVDEQIADLINGAPTTLDTLGEIATAFAESEDIIQALDKAIGQKANQSELNSLSTLVSSIQTTLDNINEWYSRLVPLIAEENGNVRIKTNIIVDGDASSK